MTPYTVTQAQSAAHSCKRVHVGDALLQVDGVGVAGMHTSMIQRLLDGPRGASITMSFHSAFDGLILFVPVALRERDEWGSTSFT